MARRLLPLFLAVAALAAAGGLHASAALGQEPGSPGWNGGPGMMGYGYLAGDGKAVTGLVDARRRAARLADRWGLRAGEVMRFERNYYVELVDGKGRGATEVLVQPRSGAVSIEYGPATMWNTRYGLMGGSAMGGMGGMMGAAGAGEPTVTPAEAVRIADRWLRSRGLRAGEAEAFPGYYTLHTLRSGKVTGMLSVNAYTGAVWLHTWHGAFVSMAG